MNTLHASVYWWQSDVSFETWIELNLFFTAYIYTIRYFEITYILIIKIYCGVCHIANIGCLPVTTLHGNCGWGALRHICGYIVYKKYLSQLLTSLLTLNGYYIVYYMDVIQCRSWCFMLCNLDNVCFGILLSDHILIIILSLMSLSKNSESCTFYGLYPDHSISWQSDAWEVWRRMLFLACLHGNYYIV